MQNTKLQFKIQNSRSSIFTLESGFTLIEIIVVLAIIGMLSGLAMTNFTTVIQKSRDGQRKADLRQIQSALEMYRADHGKYPTSVPNCSPSLKGDCSSTRTYLETVPKDPSTKIYYFYKPVTAGSPFRYCLKTCLEITNDFQKDATNNQYDTECGFVSGDNANCDGVKKWSYTLKNP